MAKRVILWLIPLLVIAVFAIAFLVVPALGTHAATIHKPVAGPSTTATPSGSASPNVLWGGQ